MRHPQVSAVVLHSAALALQSCCHHIDRTRVAPFQRLVCSVARHTTQFDKLSRVLVLHLLKPCSTSLLRMFKRTMPVSLRRIEASTRGMPGAGSPVPIRIFSCVKTQEFH